MWRECHPLTSACSCVCVLLQGGQSGSCSKPCELLRHCFVLDAFGLSRASSLAVRGADTASMQMRVRGAWTPQVCRGAGYLCGRPTQSIAVHTLATLPCVHLKGTTTALLRAWLRAARVRQSERPLF